LFGEFVVIDVYRVAATRETSVTFSSFVIRRAAARGLEIPKSTDGQSLQQYS
jgi:hypothetical protein